MPLEPLSPVDVAPGYSSPYDVRFTTPDSTRLAGFDAWPWNDASAQAVVAASEWYTADTATRWGSWGPRARAYPAPSRPMDATTARERVISVAAALIGLDYQHHHVPAWNPPPTWPWKDVRSGRRGPGLDCSNFLGFVFSYALGIGLPTGIAAQAELHRAPVEGRLRSSRVAQIEGGYDDLVAELKPADIVYVRSDAGAVSHAVLWLGTCGTGLGTAPLVLDAHGAGVLDARRTLIPAGIRIRPYRRDGWYARGTAWAHRIIAD